jgi:hypothetical protein
VREASLARQRISARGCLARVEQMLAQLILHNVRLLQPETLCVPVMKNGVAPDNSIAELVKDLDVECWDVEEQTFHPASIGSASPPASSRRVPRRSRCAWGT